MTVQCCTSVTVGNREGSETLMQIRSHVIVRGTSEWTRLDASRLKWNPCCCPDSSSSQWQWAMSCLLLYGMFSEMRVEGHEGNFFIFNWAMRNPGVSILKMLKAVKNYQSKQAVECFPSGTLLKKELVNGTMGGKQSLNYPSWRFLHKAAALWKCGLPWASTKGLSISCVCASASLPLMKPSSSFPLWLRSGFLTMSGSLQLLPVSASSLRSGFLTDHSLDCHHHFCPPLAPPQSPASSGTIP